MTTKYRPSSIAVYYDVDREEIIFQVIEDTKLLPLLTGVAVPVCLADFEHRIDDEFARRFGVAILNSLAMFKPELKPFMSVAEQPMPPLDSTPPPAPAD
ncbi:hypothetical protein AWB81_01927 [Caballeronia arationis]|jgi:hypothetical protein|uniref:Uncharacterized protein n=1 Tax=Caballeronia arationis TaxID=1777142 RepID=A0A7Z7ID62_9BURK|nr:hypothetical protein [Caballeronia arationis]SAK60053.1 hypothetical protein AWB81_01927 [Caballeronia arationis]SOE82321.1 hypothetical protein SAMN05446927_5639 [Caballeronia arationis]